MQERIAKDLLSIGAVFLRPEEPFTWASGIRSPVYCDNRLTLTAPAVRNDIETSLAELIRTWYPDAEVLMGTSTAGIAHAAIVGHIMGLPMGYVRSGNKDHGRQNRIEGRLEPGQKVVVVEDLISTGGSVIEVVDALREAGAVVLGIISIFSFGHRLRRRGPGCHPQMRPEKRSVHRNVHRQPHEVQMRRAGRGSAGNHHHEDHHRARGRGQDRGSGRPDPGI